ncbi:MAG: DNA polymerase III subunit beta [Clostridia bacterium]|nr:DNA polymerase III subunit beta [Clostridia bacterium]
MKFNCNGLILSDAATTVSKACAVRTLTPVLECIKITAKNDSLILKAYDGEISIEKTVKADVIEEGETCVNGRFFTDFINKISDKEVTVLSDEKGLEIRYDDSKSFIQAFPTMDFPAMRTEETDKFFEIKENKFKEIIAKTSFCSATDESRPILKGCLLEVKGGKMYSTALDGFRLAVSECDVEGGEEAKIICPARTLNEIAKMLAGEDKNIQVFFSKNALKVKVEETVLISRLYLGEFVNKANIYPTAFTTIVTAKKSEFIDSLERASVLIRGDKNNLILMDIKADGLNITANSEVGNVSESVKVAVSGKELKIAMNAKYLLDALKALEEETVVISFNNATDPFTLENEGVKECSYLILPVRTSA